MPEMLPPIGSIGLVSPQLAMNRHRPPMTGMRLDTSDAGHSACPGFGEIDLARHCAAAGCPNHRHYTRPVEGQDFMRDDRRRRAADDQRAISRDRPAEWPQL